MQIPGLLVEYLINGSFAMIWFLPLLLLVGYTPNQDAAAILLVFLPALYVVGMIIDFASGFVVKSQKNQIKENAYEDLDIPERFSQDVDIELLLHAPELAKSSKSRSSRDRIARGSITNTFMIMVVALFYTWPLGIGATALTVLIGSLGVALCWRMWARFQTLSYEYGIRSIKAIKEESDRDNQKGNQSFSGADTASFSSLKSRW